jgi:outer membrane protein TolC
MKAAFDARRYNRSTLGLSLIGLFTLASSINSQAGELSVVIDEAIAKNYSIINSRYEIQSTEFDKDISSAFFYPTINANANTTWNESDVRSLQPSNQNYNSNGYTLSVSQTLLDVSRYNTYRESELDVQISKLQHDKLVNDTVVEVVDNYFSYLKFHAQRKATDAQYRSSESRLKQVTRNNELGNLPKTDVYETQARKNTTSKQISDINKQINLSLNQLQSTSQTQVVPSFDVALNNQYLPISDSEKAQLKGKLVEANFDIAIAKSLLDKSKRTLSKSRSDFYPTLQASANYEYEDSNRDNSKTDTTTYSLTVDLPIFEGGSDYYEYQKNKGRIQQFSAQYDQALNDAQFALDDTVLTINANIEAMSYLRAAVIANYRVYQGNKKAYRLGTKTLTDLLNSESDLFDSIREYYTNQYDYVINVTKLRALFGAIDLEELNRISDRMIPIEDTFDLSIIDSLSAEGEG